MTRRDSRYSTCLDAAPGDDLDDLRQAARSAAAGARTALGALGCESLLEYQPVYTLRVEGRRQVSATVDYRPPQSTLLPDVAGGRPAAWPCELTLDVEVRDRDDDAWREPAFPRLRVCAHAPTPLQALDVLDAALTWSA